MAVSMCLIAAVSDAAPAFRKSIAIQNARVAGAVDHSDFPVLVKILNDADLRTTANGGQVQHAQGYDITFRAANGVTVLDHEIENYYGVNGDLFAWVRIPTLAVSADTTIYIYYGDPAVSGPTEQPNAVWTNNFHLVYHLASDFENSTGLTPAASNFGSSSTAGPIDVGRQFNDFEMDYIDTNDATDLANWTASVWTRSPNSPDGSGIAGPLMRERNYQILWDHSTAFWQGRGSVRDATTFYGADMKPLAPNTWYYLTVTYDGNDLRTFRDGNPVDTNSGPSGSVSETATAKIARHAVNTGGASFFNGEIDEVRVSSTARSPDWIKTEHNNQFDPATFYLIGSQELAPLPSTNLRSIGTAPDYATGIVSATLGSNQVTGTGTAWRSNNRGRGDHIDIAGNEYTILSVDSETQLTLTSAAIASYSGLVYTISRQFLTLQAWENCISFGGGCTFFPVASADLVADNRREVGIAYNDSVIPTDPDFNGRITFSGSTTDATHDITLTADGDYNRHYGISRQGVLIDRLGGTGIAIDIWDDFVTVEWMEVFNTGATRDGIAPNNGLAPGTGSLVVVRNNIVQNAGGAGIYVLDHDGRVDIFNNIIYNNAQGGISFAPSSLAAGSRFRVANNTIFNNNGNGIQKSGGASAAATLLLRNNISHSNAGTDFTADPGDSVEPTSSNNLASDTSATTHSPGGGGLNSIPVGNLNFVSTIPSSEDLHIQSGSSAENTGADLSGVVLGDIDGGGRQVSWDIGADDIVATTAVKLVSFEALGGEGVVALSWETASEVDNLGFHLYRARSADGPFKRLTTTAIPGLGNSPVGARYSFEDRVENGVRYYYLLEDIETTGRTERHGPVSATTKAGTRRPREPWDSPERGDDGDDSRARITFGQPDQSSLRIVRRSRRDVVLELRTEGFYADALEDGTVRLSAPEFVQLDAEDDVSIPLRRHWLDAVAGRKVLVTSIREMDQQWVGSLTPSSSSSTELVASRNGAVRLRHVARGLGSHPRSGLHPEQAARVVEVGFQGDRKKALLELAPIRWDATSERLLLSKRIRVRVSFRGRDTSETSYGGSRGRRYRGDGRWRSSNLVARLVTQDAGLYAVRFEDVFTRSGRRARSVRLSRQGNGVAYHLEPQQATFGPGSTLYFYSEGAALNPYGTEAVYELTLGSGERMPLVPAAAETTSQSVYLHRNRREDNRLYQAALLDAPDRWLWDVLLAPVRKTYTFQASAVAPGPAELRVWFQGTSDLPAAIDHHVRLYLNDSLVGEASWDGKAARLLNAEVTGLVVDGDNRVEIENVGDTSAAYSMVMLDRFEVDYARRAVADAQHWQGIALSAGGHAVSGLGSRAAVLELSPTGARWLQDIQAAPSGEVLFQAREQGHYLAVGAQSLKRPAVRRPLRTRLRDVRQQADYLLIGPEAFVEAAKRLLEHRKGQGLTVRAASLEQIVSEFGHGESSPDAVQAFLAYAYHEWRAPSFRYILLLGDTSYDPKNHLATGVRDHLPSPTIRTSYLWTVSDVRYAALNGEDSLPDVAIGRLPAANREELRTMIDKIIDYETHPTDETVPIVLVADNPDTAGNFQADADGLAHGVLSGRQLQKIFLTQLGATGTREQVHNAFNEGASLVSYLGHGGIHLWASENIFSTNDVDGLEEQAQMPILFTMNCLNGYFHFPHFNSLSEELLKAKDKGVVAAFSPSGLSLNAPAHRFHQALLHEVTRADHRRLGDAVLAAQQAYSLTGGFPELLSIYHLLGDPALLLSSSLKSRR